MPSVVPEAPAPAPHDNGPGSAPGRVLSTLNEDGTRRWVRPELARGRFYYRRLAVAWFLIASFVGLPFLHVNNKPVFLLDVLHRRFTFFGATFLPTDTVLLMLLMLTIFLTIFLLTAVLPKFTAIFASRKAALPMPRMIVSPCFRVSLRIKMKSSVARASSLTPSGMVRLADLIRFGSHSG